jgi:hypothetical protein
MEIQDERDERVLALETMFRAWHPHVDRSVVAIRAEVD